MPSSSGFYTTNKKASGVTVLRGIAGFGPDGDIHMASLMDLSLDLPLIVEFYDVPERVKAILKHLQMKMGLSHTITWPAVGYLRHD